MPASGASYSEATRKGSLQASLPSRRGPLVILDEIHRVPGLFEPLRGIIDQRRREGRRAGHFLLLGSASIDLLRQTGETLAGRVAYCEMQPLNVREAAGLDADDLWHRGGMPDSLLATNDAGSFEWRFDFIRTYLERDIPALGPRIPGETLRRFWTMLAHDQGQPFNAALLARSLGLSGRTVGRYLDLMVDLLLVRRLVSWRRNVGKRLVKAPRSYLRDSGICHALLGIESFDTLLGHPVVGGSWEGFVIENILSGVPPHVSCAYYRTVGGAEIDLVLELARISHTHKKHRSPGDVKFMYGMNLTRFPTEDRCPHTVSPFPWHFKGARGAG